MKLLLFSLLLYPLTLVAGDLAPKYLHYQYSDSVIVTISNIPCTLKSIDSKYQAAAIATRTDGQIRAGCYTHISEDTLEFQWYGGEVISLPANAFLLNHPGPENANPLGKPTPKITL